MTSFEAWVVPDPLPAERLCPHCKETKPFTEYYMIQKTLASGDVRKVPHWLCKPCAMAYNKQYNKLVQRALQRLKERYPEDYKELLNAERDERRKLEMPSQEDVTKWLRDR